MTTTGVALSIAHRSGPHQLDGRWFVFHKPTPETTTVGVDADGLWWEARNGTVLGDSIPFAGTAEQFALWCLTAEETVHVIGENTREVWGELERRYAEPAAAAWAGRMLTVEFEARAAVRMAREHVTHVRPLVGCPDCDAR